LLAALHELMPNGRVSAPKHLPRHDGLPGMSDLMRNTISNSLTWPVKMGAYLSTYFSPLQMFAGNALGELVGWPLRLLQRDGIPTIKNTVPATVFNAPVSPHRVFEAVNFDLQQLSRMRDCVPGATINDVLITVIARAMREYLQHKGTLPESSLVAEAPMTSRSEMKVNSVRNLADSAIISMHTDCANPAEHLRQIVQETRNNKKNFQSFLGKRLLIDATDLLPSVLMKTVGELIRRSRLGTRLSPQFNTTISSIRGPDLPLYMAGAKMVGYYGMDVVHDLAGINHLICYFAGNATISVTACRKMMPDPARYCACLQQAFVQLHASLLDLEAAAALPAPTKRTRKRRTAAA
jgi:WS/DGAT/MGAT family acyltransferase